MRREKGCACGAWVLLAVGVAVGLAASWAAGAVQPQSPVVVTEPPHVACPEREELAQCRDNVARAQQHLLEAQQDYRRCLLSHTPSVAAAVRGGRSSSSSAGVEGAAGALRAALLQELGGSALVPRPDASIDVVLLWVNGSDPAWQYARNAATQPLASLHGDNGELLACIRSLVKVTISV
jgi:hypothetical protein